MKMPHVEPARAEHLASLLAGLDQSRAEIAWSAIGMEPERVAREALEGSAAAWVWIAEDRVACMFGVGQLQVIGPAIGWMLATELVEKYRFTFVRHCRETLKNMLVLHPSIEAFVDIRFEKSVHWMKWMGFRVNEAPIPYLNTAFYRAQIGSK